MDKGCLKCGKTSNMEKYCPSHGRGCEGCGFSYDIILCRDCDFQKMFRMWNAFLHIHVEFMDYTNVFQDASNLRHPHHLVVYVKQSN
jgi:hypothetical protein